MLDAREAIKGLDGYSEVLISLSVLIGSKMFEDKSDEKVRNSFEGLLGQIKEKRQDAKWLALEIMKETQNTDTKTDPSGDLTGISAAIQRYVLADEQVSEALKKKDPAATPPNSVSEAIRRFREKAGLIEQDEEPATPADIKRPPARD